MPDTLKNLTYNRNRKEIIANILYVPCHKCPFFLKPIVQFLIAVISSSTLTQSFTLFPLSLSDLPGVLLAISVIVRRRSLFDWLSVTSSLSGGFMYGCQIKHAHLAPHVTPQLFNWWSPNLDSRGQEENKRDYFSFPLCILLLSSTAKLYCTVLYICSHLRYYNSPFVSH